MSTLVLVLAAGITVSGNGPEMVSGKVEQRLDLSGEWKGTWQLPDGQFTPAFSTEQRIPGVPEGGIIVGEEWDGRSIFIRRDSLIEEESGYFSLRFKGRRGSLGIYQQDGDRVVLCFRIAGKGYPRSFRGGNGQHLLILHRVKPGK